MTTPRTQAERITACKVAVVLLGWIALIDMAVLVLAGAWTV